MMPTGDVLTLIDNLKYATLHYLMHNLNAVRKVAKTEVDERNICELYKG